jgi:hypothetical protein
MLAVIEIFILTLPFGFLRFSKLVLQAYSSDGSSWVLDIGYTNHMTEEKSMFSSYSPHNKFK